MKAITYRLITLLAFLVLPFSGISQAYVKQDNACVPIDAPHPTKRIFFEKPMQLNEYVSPWFQAVTCSDVEKEGILEVDYVKVFQLDDNGNATRIQTINYNDSKPLTENEGRLYKRAWNDKNLFFYENATKQMSNSIKVDSSLKIDVGSFPNDVSHWWCKRFLGSTHYRYFTVVKFKIKGEIAFQMGCDYYQNPDNLLNCKEAWVSEWYGDTNGAFVIDTFPKYSNSSFDCMDYGFTSEGVFYFSERFIDYAAADSVYLGGSFNGWSSKVKLSLRNGYYQHNTNKQLDTPQIYYIAAYYDNKVAYIPHLLIDKIANPNDVKSNGNNGYNFETSPNDSIGCIELYLPQKAGKPTGENNLCIPASNTEYNTTGAKNANTYHWKIHPTEAGTTNSITNYATVEWNNTFTGMARISVAGENEYGQGRFSEELTIQVNSETIPGIIESDSIICINKKTNSLILKNYSGQILRWQKKYETSM